MEKDETKQLTNALESLDNHVEQLIKEEAFWRSFIKGVLGSLGAALGATIILGLIVYILQKLAGTPFLGHYILDALNTLRQNK